MEQDQPQQDQYKRIGQDQFDIWMDNPVTVAYLKCLEWSSSQISEVMGKGGYVDSTNNDITSNKIHSAIGKQSGLNVALNPRDVMVSHEMLAQPKGTE